MSVKALERSPNMNHSKTHDIINFTKKNPLQINELLNMILGKLKVQKLIHLRAVCNHWKLSIEAICAQKHCLLLFSIAQRNRFVWTIKIDQLVLLRFKPNKYNFITQFENNSCEFLGQLFPNVTQLMVSVYMKEDSAINLFNMIEHYWSKMHTLSIKGIGPDVVQLCVDRISDLKSLKRLDLWGDLKMLPNSKLINLLEQFFCYDCGSNKILDKIHPLGAECTSFWYEYSILDISELDRWIKRNSVQVIAKLTHLDLTWVHDPNGSQAIRLICRKFKYLKVFKFKYSETTQFNRTTCSQLAKLTQLTTLSIGSAQFDLDSLDESTELFTPLLSIRVLHLTEFEMYVPFDDDDDDSLRTLKLNCKRFCLTLASIVPNVEELGICASELWHRKLITSFMIEDHFSCFAKLRKYSNLVSIFVSNKCKCNQQVEPSRKGHSPI